MAEQQIVAFDWARLWWGDMPPLFLLEIGFRIAVIWLWTLVLLRWIGGRSIAQLSLVEFLLVIALGSAVGDSLFYPEVPLIPAMLVILALVCLDKLVDIAVRRWRYAKTAIDGQPHEVLREGRILSEGLVAQKIGTHELLEMLRLKGVTNLASVGAAYLEPSGQLSVFPSAAPGMGMPIVPPPELGAAPAGPGPNCCCGCGCLRPDPDPCPHCGVTEQIPAQQAPRWRA